MTKLNELAPREGSTKGRMRVGRGPGSGKGKTSGRGVKGQKARTGVALNGFEGGQLPIYRRLPKRGFKSPTVKFNAEIRLSDLERLDLPEVDLLALKQAGLVPELAKNVKVIAAGQLTKKVVLKGVAATKGAKAAIEAAGGSLAE